MEWILWIGVAVNDPSPVEIARYKAEQDCRRGALLIQAISAKAKAQSEGKTEFDPYSPEVYADCKKPRTE